MNAIRRMVMTGIGVAAGLLGAPGGMAAHPGHGLPLAVHPHPSETALAAALAVAVASLAWRWLRAPGQR